MWLIAEDELDIRNLVEMLCRAWGYDALVFEDGQRVWDWLDKVEAGQYSGPMPELALMDIRMPGKKGDEVAQRIRCVSALKDIPIVLMTAFALTDSQKDVILKNGADKIIGKPLPDFDKLHAILHNLMYSKA